MLSSQVLWLRPVDHYWWPHCGSNSSTCFPNGHSCTVHTVSAGFSHCTLILTLVQLFHSPSALTNGWQLVVLTTVIPSDCWSGMENVEETVPDKLLWHFLINVTPKLMLFAAPLVGSNVIQTCLYSWANKREFSTVPFANENISRKTNWKCLVFGICQIWP